MKFSRNAWLGTILLVVSASVSAQASVLFTVARQSDKVARITASGTLDGPQSDFNAHILVFDGLVTGLVPGIGGWENQPVLASGSTMAVGSSPLDGAYTRGPGLSLSSNPVIYAFNKDYKTFNVGDEITGELVLKLTRSSGILAPVASTGNVYWGVDGNQHMIGVYNIENANSNLPEPVLLDADVPEPTSLALLGVGLLGVSAVRRPRCRI